MRECIRGAFGHAMGRSREEILDDISSLDMLDSEILTGLTFEVGYRN
jgi:hypothetical protein